MSASSLPTICIRDKTYEFLDLIKSPDWMDDVSLNEYIKVKHTDDELTIFLSDDSTLLCVACLYASHTVVEWLLNNGARTDVTDGKENTPLHYACLSKIDPMQKVKYLINANPKLLTCTNVSLGFTPLHVTVMNPDPSILDHILKFDVDINAKSVGGHTPLLFAFILGREHLIALLCTCTDVDVNIQNYKGNTLLHYAAKWGSVEIINHLLRAKRIDVNMKNLHEKTPLHRSVQCKKEEATAALLSHPDVNTNLQDLNGNTPAHTAAKNKNRILLNMLISHHDFKGSIRNGDRATVTEIVAGERHFQRQLICSAIQNHQPHIIWVLLSTHEIQCESDVLNVNSYQGSGGKEHCSTTQFVEWRDNKNNTILHLLCKHLALDEVLDDPMHEILQVCLPLVNIHNNDGDTPVHLAIKHKNLCLLELLLKQADTDINVRNRTEDNALHLALKMKYIEAMRCILTNKRVDIKAQNQHGDTALHLAIGTDASEYIIEQPCINEVVNLQNKSGKTPIIVATEANEESCIEKLLEMSHIDLNLRDINGHTAAVVALMEGHNTIFNMLRGHDNYIRNPGQEYKMTASTRGYALMINMTADRDGSDVDEQKMTDLFTFLNFKVVKEGLRNCKKPTILATMRDLVHGKDANENKPALAGHDCLVVVIMAHGHEDIFKDIDGNPVRYSEIMDMFNGENCEALRDKPKLFFVQVCRGTLEDIKSTPQRMETEACTTDTETVQHSDTGGAEAYSGWCMSTPRYSDILISYATWPGYASYRNETRGSAYIAALCEVLHDKAAHTHLTDMLTEVNEKVAKDCKLRPVLKFVNKCFKEKLQTPVYHSSLRRKLYFFSTKPDFEE